jgi:hypothetical protein
LWIWRSHEARGANRDDRKGAHVYIRSARLGSLPKVEFHTRLPRYLSLCGALADAGQLVPSNHAAPLLALLKALESYLDTVVNSDEQQRQNHPNYAAREGVLVTLMVLMDFLEAVGVRRPATLTRLVKALLEVNRGRTPRLFTPSLGHRGKGYDQR